MRLVVFNLDEDGTPFMSHEVVALRPTMGMLEAFVAEGVVRDMGCIRFINESGHRMTVQYCNGKWRSRKDQQKSQAAL